MLHRNRPQKTLGLVFVTFFQILLFYLGGRGKGERGVWAYGLLTVVTCSSIVYQPPCIDSLDRNRIYELLISMCWLFLWNIIFINRTLTKSCQKRLRRISRYFVLQYTIFQYFLQILVIPTLPSMTLFNYNALLHSNGDHFFDFTSNRLLVPHKKSFGLWYREEPTSY